MDHKINNRLGLIWILISVFFASIMAISVKELGQIFDSRLLVLFRAGLLIFFLGIPALIVSDFRKKLKFTEPKLHISRGILIAFSTHLGFYTLTKLPIATTTVLFFTAPIFATVLSIYINKEKVGYRRWFAVIIGFLGVIIILQPGFNGFYFAMITALFSSFLFAVALAYSRRIVLADGVVSTYLSSVLITFLISIPIAYSLLESSYFGSIPMHILALIILLATTSFLRGIGDMQAYRYGEAAILAPFTYLRLILVGIVGYFLWGEIPNFVTLLGAFVIIGSAIYIGHRETKHKNKV
jgi:drug/metabolite transporter (DMT)-like permease